MRQAIVVLSYIVCLMFGVALFTEASAAVGQTGDTVKGQKEKPADKKNKQVITEGSELVIVLKTNDKGTAILQYKMGERIRIKATGTYKTKIGEALKKAKAIVLYLDDVRMTSLVPSTSLAQDGSARYLDFYLSRDSQNAESRDQWKSFLAKQHGFDMYPQIALSIDGDGPYLIKNIYANNKKIQFNITTARQVYAVLVVSVIIFVLVYWRLIMDPSALRDTKDGYYSLGKSQMAFWGLIVFLTFLGVLVITGSMEWIPDQVLVLLGISGATGLSSVVMTERKTADAKKNLEDLEQEKNNLEEEINALEEKKRSSPTTFTQVDEQKLKDDKKTLEKLDKEIAELTAKPDKYKFFRDITDDGNGLSVHRLQVVAWTILLGCFFVYSVINVISMPEFSDTLLTLMGISNLMYLGFKFPEKV